MEFILVDTIEDVMKITLQIDLPNSLLFSNSNTIVTDQNSHN
jgi:hypothetical protein